MWACGLWAVGLWAGKVVVRLGTLHSIHDAIPTCILHLRSYLVVADYLCGREGAGGVLTPYLSIYSPPLRLEFLSLRLRLCCSVLASWM